MIENFLILVDNICFYKNILHLKIYIYVISHENLERIFPSIPMRGRTGSSCSDNVAQLMGWCSETTVISRGIVVIYLRRFHLLYQGQEGSKVILLEEDSHFIVYLQSAQSFHHTSFASQQREHKRAPKYFDVISAMLPLRQSPCGFSSPLLKFNAFLCWISIRFGLRIFLVAKGRNRTSEWSLLVWFWGESNWVETSERRTGIRLVLDYRATEMSGEATFFFHFYALICRRWLILFFFLF